MSEESKKGFQEGDADERITAGKVASFLKSAWSKGLNARRTDSETKRLRVISCHGDVELGIAPCEWRRQSEKADGVHYCGACGCGDNAKTWLDTPPNEPDAYTKLDYPKVVCPLQMPGFSNYVPYGQEDDGPHKEKVGVRKQQVDLKLFENNIDSSHDADEKNPDFSSEDLHDTKYKEPEKPKRTGCKSCGRGGKRSRREFLEEAARRSGKKLPDNTSGCKKCGQKKKNNVDDLPLG